MADLPDRVPSLAPDNPNEIVRRFFRATYPEILKKVSLQVRRSPRRQTGRFKTNRQSRWKLKANHPDYTAADQIPLIEGKLLALILEFNDGPDLAAEVQEAASAVLGRVRQAGTYSCPISGRHMSFLEMLREARHPVVGRSSFHVGHVRPKAKGGQNVPDNMYWTTDLGREPDNSQGLYW